MHLQLGFRLSRPTAFAHRDRGSVSKPDARATGCFRDASDV